MTKYWKKFIISVGEISELIAETFYWIFSGQIDRRNTREQMYETGWRSLPVIFLTAIFTGMVLALETGSSTISVFSEPVYLGTIVAFSMIKELAPVLTSVVIAGRVGAAIAAEIGTMKVTEQLDALSTLGTDPIKYLAVPRFIGVISMVPFLVLFADAVGVIGGLLVSVYKWEIPITTYWEDAFSYMYLEDFFHGLIKSVFFALIIVAVSCYKGFSCEGGAEGVGKATTSAVMISMVLILVSDYFITSALVLLGIG